jgi:ATPase subunit of ABC transporter with duplicated ATPase domains
MNPNDNRPENRGEMIIRFEKVTFEYSIHKPILHEVDFAIRRGSKITVMGQNGAGKSTLFALITGALKPEDGQIHVQKGLSIAVSRQVIPRADLDLAVLAFFEKSLEGLGKKVYDIDPRIEAVLDVVNLKAPHDRIVRSFSGGQQARLLLASALIQDPDVLLLDEPTNNLDKAGIEHLTDFLVKYKKTVVVISHDSDFLNAFTHGVLYLDIHTRKIEQYVGNYLDVVADISARIEKENRKNAQLAKEIQANKDKANFFAMKGGQMRLVAKRMREKAEELEESKVDVRKEDKPIRAFVIPVQENLPAEIVHITKFKMIKNHKPTARKCAVTLRKNMHLLLAGPNGIGKSTLLEAMAKGEADGTEVAEGVRVGYYRQDFSTLNFEDTVYDSLAQVLDSVTGRVNEDRLRTVTAGFLIGDTLMHSKIGSLSEGQKGLVAFARLVLQKPGLLILDEPTNHINFRHIPLIAAALNSFEGAMILVSHVPEFVKQIRIDETLNLEK